MNTAEFQLRGVSDPRLAVHATSPVPAWLWSTDGTHILWANPVGATVFGAANSAHLANRTFGPADTHRRQVAQLAHRLPPAGAVRLERLRGFGASLGMHVTCVCARLDFADGGQGILIVTAEPVVRPMPLVERLQRVVEGIDTPIAAFASDGMFIAASEPARSLLGFHNLSEAGLDEVRVAALTKGRAETPLGIGHVVLQRIGAGADVGLIALIAPGAAQAAQNKHAQVQHAQVQHGQVKHGVRHTAPPSTTLVTATPANQRISPPGDLPVPEYERPAMSGEAPAEFALIDEFAETEESATATEVLAVEPVASAQSSEFSSIEARREEAEAVVGEAPSPAAAPPGFDETSSQPRRYPLRFMWQMDSDGRFSISRDEFTHLIGVRTAAGFGRPWGEIAEAFGLDPEGRVARAVATRSTWSGISLQWPVDGGGRLPVELSGLPIYDHTGSFTGYRGFGVCRDLDVLARLEALRRLELPGDQRAMEAALSASVAASVNEPPSPKAPPAATRAVEPVTALESATSGEADSDKPVEPPDDALKNVIPFRPVGEPRGPVLTPVENSAFNELARQLSARLEGDNGVDAQRAREAVVEPLALPEKAEPPHWLARPEPPARGESMRDRMLLDLLPDGVLIYRLDRLLYANRAFLERIGYPSLHALEQAGGLDALYVEPGVSSASSASDTGTPVTISAQQTPGEATPASAIEARLYAISWDDEAAHALIFAGSGAPAESAPPAASPPPPAVRSAVGHANAEELGAILDTAAEGIVIFDAEGNINSCNRSAEALFGYDGAELVRRNLATLFAPESQPAVADYLASLKGTGVASLLEHGREVLGRVRGGRLIPLSMTMGRTQVHGPSFFAVFRDLSQTIRSESELREARRLADRAANAKTDLLARISHEIRTPLNAIIGFAEVMIAERFGTLGNERYVEYMNDIRASGERVIAIIDDLTELGRIETGKLDLAFTPQNLNELVENCVALMQPQANRERIIIRTSLAAALPPVVADARALRQIAQNLIGNSIHLAKAGGQVIVSTASTEFGDVVLRVRDTGQGLNDDEVAAAMAPFRTQGPSDQAPEGSPGSLSLTKALVEANRAKFHIRTGTRSGTLIEVVFSPAMAKT